MNTTIVITGNPVDGLFFYGPFNDRDTATEWAELNQDGMDWWLAPLAGPTDQDLFNIDTDGRRFLCDTCGRVGTTDDGISDDGDDCPDEDCGGTVHVYEVAS